MPYEPALDGLRALSVIAVICYHAGFTWMHGGFVGVEVFFVVSGYLITALLLDERDRSRRTNLPQFWLRRARRLLPALFMMLMVTAVWAMIAGSAAERAQLRRDLPWSIFYAGNWGQIAGGVPYWATDPPLLRHLWSLGVEEQWYLLWPLLFVVLSTLPLRRRAVAVVLAAASLAAMVAMFWLHGNGPGPIHSGIDAFDGADRINFMYLATFTRCAGLLLGAAAAHVWRPWRWSRVARHPVTNVPLLDAAGGGAVAGLFVIACSVSILDGYVYQWLLALVSILSLVAVLTAVHPGASWHRAALSLPPLVAIGRRSYGLYLWSWPIFVILGATHGSVARVMVALAVTAVVSEACYRFVELPVRHGALGRWWRRSPPRQRLIPLAWATAAVVAIVAFYATVGPYNRALGGADASFSLPTSTVATRDDGRRRGDAWRGGRPVDVGGRRRAAAGRRRRRFHRLCPGAQRARRDRRHVRHHRRFDRGMQRLRRRLDAELQRRPRPLLRRVRSLGARVGRCRVQGRGEGGPRGARRVGRVRPRGRRRQPT